MIQPVARRIASITSTISATPNTTSSVRQDRADRDARRDSTSRSAVPLFPHLRSAALPPSRDVWDWRSRPGNVAECGDLVANATISSTRSILPNNWDVVSAWR